MAKKEAVWTKVIGDRVLYPLLSSQGHALQ